VLGYIAAGSRVIVADVLLRVFMFVAVRMTSRSTGTFAGAT